MNISKETYERLLMDVTEFEAEDVITTSGITPPAFAVTNPWKIPVGF